MASVTTGRAPLVVCPEPRSDLERTATEHALYIGG